MKKVLTIAGSDCSGGAGIQADLKTMTAHGVYGMSVITALTAQNTTGVQGIFSIPGEFVAKQLDSVFSDIRPDAVKIGMMSNVEIIETVAERLKHYEFTNIVLDPVMVSTSRHRLLEPSAEEALIRILLPMARILTPNLPEAMVLAHRDDITNRDEMLEAAKVIATETGAAILVKGGHLTDCADDLLYDHGNVYWYSAPRIDTDNTHGTGCTLSSAIASGLALGMDLNTAVASAKEYITGALRNDPHLGHGNGPLNHCYKISG